MSHSRPRPTIRTAVAIGTAALGAAALTLLAAPAAFAHTTVSATSTAAGSYTVLTFASGHGCDGSPTTSFAISLPESIVAASPTVYAGWTAEKVMETLDEPIDNGHGGEYTERVAQIVYTADTPLAEGYRAAFEVSVQLPDAAGETLYFPTVQSCEVGSNDWIEIPAEAQSSDELASPAPALEITEAAGGAHGHGDAETDSVEAEREQADGGFPVEALSIAGLVLGVAALVVSILAFVVRRRPAA